MQNLKQIHVYKEILTAMRNIEMITILFNKEKEM